MEPDSPAVARILARDGSTVSGSGFLVAPGLVLTCAHVVEDALGGQSGTVSSAKGQALDLEFPLRRPVKRYSATVLFFEYDGSRWDDDVAVLRIHGPAPDGLVPLRLAQAADVWRHRYRAFGFLDGRPDGVWTSGHFLGPQGTGLVQLIDDADVEFHIDQGFSGTPLWDEELGAVAGMVIAKERAASHEPGARTAYAMLTGSLMGVWPELRRHARPPCPFRGLRAFREQDREWFFGRESTAAQLVAHLGEHRIVPLSGQSGAGKSSLLFAGVAPLMRARGDTSIAVVSADPDVAPHRMLARALTPLLISESSEVDQLAAVTAIEAALDRGQLTEAIERCLDGQDTQQLLFVVDGFEALLARSDEPAAALMSVLIPLTKESPGGRPPSVRVLIALRADFLARAMSAEALAASMSGNELFWLNDLDPAQLRRAIEKPVLKIGTIRFESGLVDRILADVGSRRGALPLVEFVLTLLWEREQAGVMTHAVYEQLGTAAGALAQYAEEKWHERLDADERTAAARLFSQLVRPGAEGMPDTHRAATRAELGPESWNLASKLLETRLIVTSVNASGTQSVELAHDALILRWQRLAEWVEADRTFRLWQEELRAQRVAWEASGRAKHDLLTRRRVREAASWLESRSADLADAEIEYIRLSRRRTRGRMRRWTASLAAIVLAFTAVGVYAERAGNAVAAQLAQQQSHELVIAAQKQQLPADTAASLSVAAYRKSPTSEARTQLFHAYIDNMASWRILDPSGTASVEEVAVSADGQELVTLTDDNELKAFRLTATGDTVPLLSVDDVSTFALSPARSRPALAIGKLDGSVAIVDLPSGRPIRTITPPASTGSTAPGVEILHFDRAAQWLAVVMPSDDRVSVWNMSTGAHTTDALPSPEEQRYLADVGFSFDTSSIVGIPNNGEAAAWDVRTGRLLRQLNDIGTLTMAVPDLSAQTVPLETLDTDGSIVEATCDGSYTAHFVSPQGDAPAPRPHSVIRCGPQTGILLTGAGRIVTADTTTQAVFPASPAVFHVWDVKTGELLWTVPAPDDAPFFKGIGEDGPHYTASADAGLLAYASGHSVRLIRIEANAALLPRDAQPFMYTPDGRYLLTASSQGWDEWDTRLSRHVASLASAAADGLPDLTDAAFSPDGSTLAIPIDGSNTVALYAVPDLRFSRTITLPEPALGTGPYTSSVGFDSDRLLMVSFAGRIGQFDTTTGAEIGTPLVFVPDPTRVGNAGSFVFAARPGSDEFAIVSPDGSAMELWDAKERRRTAAWTAGLNGAIATLVFSRDGSALVAADSHGDLVAISIPDGRLLGRYTSQTTGAAVTPAADGNEFLLTSPNGALVWNPLAGARALSTAAPDNWQVGLASPDAVGIVYTFNIPGYGALPGAAVLASDNPGTWISTLCSVVRRPLSGAEQDALPSDVSAVQGCP